jgi:hypothetical protein
VIETLGRRPPPWIYPPDDYAPFDFITPPATTLLDTEAELGSFITMNRWLRVATLEVTDSVSQADYMRIIGEGWGDLVEFIPFGDQGGPGGAFPAEFPVFALLPPNTQHRFLWLGAAHVNISVRVVGWYMNL